MLQCKVAACRLLSVPACGVFGFGWALGAEVTTAVVGCVHGKEAVFSTRLPRPSGFNCMLQHNPAATSSTNGYVTLSSLSVLTHCLLVSTGLDRSVAWWLCPKLISTLPARAPEPFSAMDTDILQGLHTVHTVCVQNLTGSTTQAASFRPPDTAHYHWTCHAVGAHSGHP